MRNATLSLFVAGLLVPQVCCFAQGSKPAQPAATPTTTASDPSEYLARDWYKASDLGRTGDRLLGNVTLASGALPWDPIGVSVTCDGEARYTTKTDSRGVFVIGIPQAIGSTTYVGTEKSLLTRYAGCKVSAVLPGFDSSELTIVDRGVLDHPNIGTITLKREEGSAGSAVSVTTASAPKAAMRAFEKAREAWLENKPDRAERELQKAVDVYPRFAEAWYQLGKTQASSKSEAAFSSFSKAVTADPKFALPYEQMAPLSAQAGKWTELNDEMNRALELNPRGTLDLWYYKALANYHLKKLDVAATSAAKSLSMDPLHVQPDTEQLLAVILVAKPDLAGALLHLRNCLTYFPPGPNYELVKRQIAQIEKVMSTSGKENAVAGDSDRQKSDEVLTALSAFPSPGHRTSDPGPPIAISAGATRARGERWLPPDVDDVAAPVEPGTACNLDEVLPKVGHRIQQFVDDVEHFTSTQSISQETLNKAGDVTSEGHWTYDYIVSIKESRPGILNVKEYLNSDPTAADSPGGVISKGLPALLLIFHPYDSSAFYMKCEGMVTLNGHRLWQIYFRQRPDRPNTTLSYSFGPNHPSYLVALKGRAWFTADSYQMVRLQTDLINPVPEIRLTADHIAVDYGPVHFRRRDEEMWVPHTAEHYIDLKGIRVHQRMSFGNYLLFAVDETEKISAPKTEP
ncbi:MAG: hypothetical protein WAK48_11700 [Candidatus Acidiferrum sp.]|jgi:hypothetical protein